MFKYSNLYIVFGIINNRLLDRAEAGAHKALYEAEYLYTHYYVYRDLRYGRDLANAGNIIIKNNILKNCAGGGSAKWPPTESDHGLSWCLCGRVVVVGWGAGGGGRGTRRGGIV